MKILIGLVILLAGCDASKQFTVYERDNGTFDAHAEISCNFVGLGETKDEALANLKQAIGSRKPTTCFRNNIKSTLSGTLE